MDIAPRPLQEELPVWIGAGGTPASCNSRCMAQVGLGGLPFAETARSIELLATEIMPAVRRELMGTKTA